MNEYEELDSIAIPEAIPAFGLEAGDTGCIVSKWVGEWEGLSGTYLLVDIPKEDGTSYGSASVLVEASGETRLMGVSPAIY
jgi:hypothetical protein